MTNLISLDLFAGAGGASWGHYLATGRHPDVAVNHNPLAVEVHALNHPDTEHWVQNIFQVSPYAVAQGRKIGRMWASPDCTYHSSARGGKPIRDVTQRDLPFVISGKWIPALKPLVFHMENVKELLQWGPLDSSGRIVPEARGDFWRAFVRQIRRQGYAVEWRVLRACDFGVATTRERLYLTARRDRKPIVWPEPTHGAPDSPEVLSGLRLPWRTAAEFIDWSLPCPSIFDSSAEIKAKFGLQVRRPLKEPSLRRIAAGLQRFVLDNPKPFIVHYFGDKDGKGRFRGADVDAPLSTVTAGGNRHGLVVPQISVYLPAINSGPLSSGQADDPHEPKHALAATHLLRHFGCSTGSACDFPSPTVMATGQGKTGVVVSWLSKMRENYNSHKTDSPPQIPTVSENHFANVCAFVTKYYGKSLGQAVGDPQHTICSREGFGLVLCRVGEETFAIRDIGMRMLQPSEQAGCMGFPPEYVLGYTATGGRVTKAAQNMLIGNAVCPDMARMLIAANPIENEEMAYRAPSRWQQTFWPSREAARRMEAAA